MDEVKTQVEVKPEPNLSQEKVDTNAPQKPVDIATQEESDKEINWKKFKEARALERKQAEELAARAAQKDAELQAMKAALEAVVNKPNPPVQQYGYDQEESEDQRIEKKVQAALAIAEQRRQQEQARREAEEYPHKLTSTFADFNQTIANENLDYLDYHYPEVTGPISRMPEGYDKWAAIYRAVKKFVPNTDTRKDQAKAERNFNKPQSISSPGMTHNGETAPAYILTEERKAANWARMEKARKGLK